MNPKYPDHVYMLKNALYGLKQAPRAWYERLTNYLINKGYTRGSVDKTMFIKRSAQHVLIAQIYVDDIDFGSTSKEFIASMRTEFEMGMVDE